MPDRITLNEDKETVLASAPSIPLYIHFARYVSTILSPSVISVPFIILVALYRASSTIVALGYALITLFFLSAGPLLYIAAGVRAGKFTDMDVSMRSQRLKPFLFGIASCLAGLLILSLLHAPKNLETVLLTTVMSGMIYMITTLWWKISIHASSLAGAATMLTVLYGIIFLPAFLLLALVCWSRVVLHRHTTAQVIGGSALSIVISLTALAIRGI